MDELRIGDSERDAVAVALHDHFAAGRLDRAELEERLDATLTARTGGDLRVIVRDLPAPTGLPEPAKAPARGHPHRHHGGPPFGPHMHRGHAPMFPVLLVLFAVVAFTSGAAGAAMMVLQVALLVWIVRAVLLVRRAHRPHH